MRGVGVGAGRGLLFGIALENSTSHIFVPFEFNFSTVGSFVLLSVKKYQNNNKKVAHLSPLH